MVNSGGGDCTYRSNLNPIFHPKFLVFQRPTRSRRGPPHKCHKMSSLKAGGETNETNDMMSNNVQKTHFHYLLWYRRSVDSPSHTAATAAAVTAAVTWGGLVPIAGCDSPVAWTGKRKWRFFRFSDIVYIVYIVFWSAEDLESHEVTTWSLQRRWISLIRSCFFGISRPQGSSCEVANLWELSFRKALVNLDYFIAIDAGLKLSEFQLSLSTIALLTMSSVWLPYLKERHDGKIKNATFLWSWNWSRNMFEWFKMPFND